MFINFALIGEGTSDLNLANHLETLLVEKGFEEVSGIAPDLRQLPTPPGNSVAEKAAAIEEHFSEINLIFVHRDADNAGYDARREEISQQTEGCQSSIIPIIPVKMIEAWLLCDIEKIGTIIGIQADRRPNSAPKIRNIEKLADPKKALEDIICELANARGRKLDKLKSNFYQHRARICQELETGGPVKHLPSYQKFIKNLERTLGI